MTLIVHAGSASNPDELRTMISDYEPAITLCTDMHATGTYQLVGTEMPQSVHPIPIMGPFEEVAHYRNALTAWQVLCTAASAEAAEENNVADDSTPEATAD